MVSPCHFPAVQDRHSRALRAGLAALQLLAQSGRTLGITEIARELGLSKSSAHDLLASLGELGFVDKNPETRRYAVGAAIFDFLGGVAASFGKNAQVHLLLRQRALELGVTLYIGTLCRDRSYVTAASGHYGDTGVIGYNCPWYASSCGRAVLAQLSETLWERRFPATDGERPTSRTVLEHERLRALLRASRATGVAWNEGESDADLISVAAPICLPGRPPDRAVALVLNFAELAARDRTELEREARRAARDLSIALHERLPVSRG